MATTLVSNITVFSDATGHSGQTHLIYAVNQQRWWLFYIDSKTATQVKCLVSSSADLTTATWAAGANNTPVFPSSRAMTTNDERNLGVLYVDAGGTDAVHLSVSIGATGTVNGFAEHIRATITGANTITWDSVWVEVTTAATGSFPALKGVAMGLSSTGFVHEASKSFVASRHPEVRISTAADTSASWTNAFGAVADGDTSPLFDVNCYAFARQASGAMLMLYNDGQPAAPNSTGLRYVQYTSGTTWPTGVSADVGIGVTNQHTLDWCLCRVDDTHIYAFRRASPIAISWMVNSGGSTWSQPSTEIPTHTCLSGGGMFAASDGSNLYLIALDSTGNGDILYCKASGANGSTPTWGKWIIVESAVATARGCVAGYPIVVNNQIGIIYTVVNSTNFDITLSVLSTNLVRSQYVWVDAGARNYQTISTAYFNTINSTVTFDNTTDFLGDASAAAVSAGKMTYSKPIVGCIKCATVSPAATCSIAKHGVLSDAGRRISFKFKTNKLGGNTSSIFVRVENSAETHLFCFGISTIGQIGFNTGSGDALIATATSFTWVANTWYNICICYQLGAGTNNHIKLFIDGKIVHERQFDTITAGSDSLEIGCSSTWGTNTTCWIDDVVVEDDVSFTFGGNPAVAGKLPTTAIVSTNQTTVGTGAVNERPVSATNGITLPNSGGQATYDMEAIAVGDIDFTQWWLSATSPDPFGGFLGWAVMNQSVVNGTVTLYGPAGNTTPTVTTTAAYYVQNSPVGAAAAFTSYPSSVSNSGISVTGGSGANTTALQECGVLVVFNASNFAPVTCQTAASGDRIVISMNGIKDAQDVNGYTGFSLTGTSANGVGIVVATKSAAYEITLFLNDYMVATDALTVVYDISGNLSSTIGGDIPSFTIAVDTSLIASLKVANPIFFRA